MLFKRNKKPEGQGSQKPGQPEHSRRHYRRVPSRKHALGVKLTRNGVALGSGAVGDLSIGGARLVLGKGAPPALQPNDEVELLFESLVHPTQVRARARFLRECPQPDGVLHHAFEFTDLDALYPQLDNFYWNFFNRRRFTRVRPALDRRLMISLRSGAATLEVALNDLSLGGLGFVVDAARVESMLASGHYELTLPIPASEERFLCRADRRHATSRGRNVLFGLELLELDSAPALPALRRYLSERENEMARWEAS